VQLKFEKNGSFKSIISDSEDNQTYASIVWGKVASKSPLRDSYWRCFQEEDKEQAMALAIKNSVEELKVNC